MTDCLIGVRQAMTPRHAPEPVQKVKERRDGALAALVAAVPYAAFLGIRFDRRGDELTALLPHDEALIGQTRPPTLHGGATAAFLEVTAIIALGWAALYPRIEASGTLPEETPELARTIDFTVDYLRAGLARDAYARAHVTRAGRRYASVRISAWQDHRDRPFAEAMGHFLMPEGDG